jgi:hypothetical protein
MLKNVRAYAYPDGANTTSYEPGPFSTVPLRHRFKATMWAGPPMLELMRAIFVLGTRTM